MSQRINHAQVAPEGMKALGTVYSYVSQAGLSDVLLALIYLRVAQINGCAYCLDLHMRELTRKGVDGEKLVLLPVWREVLPLFDTREQAALAWTETVTRVAETGVPDAEYQAAAAVFSDKELVDLTIAIGVMNTYTRLGVSFRKTPQAVAEKITNR